MTRGAFILKSELGKAALAEYWRVALSRIESLRFVVQRVIWDPATLELAAAALLLSLDRRDSAPLQDPAAAPVHLDPDEGPLP